MLQDLALENGLNVIDSIEFTNNYVSLPKDIEEMERIVTETYKKTRGETNQQVTVA